MSRILLPESVRTELAELQATQAAKRTTSNALGLWDPRELVALQRLAHELFKDFGVIEFRPDCPGIAFLGRAHTRQRPGKPEAHRYRPADWLFSGAGIGEISAQVEVWRSSR